MIALPLTRIPPDLDRLPALSPPFQWCLPHAKQHRRPVPQSRLVIVGVDQPAVASLSAGRGKWSTLVGTHRALHSGQHHREFLSRVTAARYVAAWASRYAEHILAEIAACNRSRVPS